MDGISPELSSNEAKGLQQQNPRAEIISLIRGGMSLPVIAQLGISGIIDALLKGSYAPDERLPGYSILVGLLRYLVSQGLLVMRAAGDPNTTNDIVGLKFVPTAVGRKVLSRWGTFAIVNSYSDYFGCLDQMINTGAPSPGTSVRRRENVIGSGAMHRQKFFPLGLDMVLKDTGNIDVLVDLGCGDGLFASALCGRQVPELLVGVDISVDVVALFNSRLAAMASVIGYVANASDIRTWSEALRERRGQRVLISLWFVLHEFCDGNVQKAQQFFVEVHARCPQAELLIGEVVMHPPELLARNRASTIMPEFQLFHLLSGQGLLTWPQFESLRTCIPYHIAAERRIDEIEDVDGARYPCNLIWHLTPRGTDSNISAE